MFLLFVRRGAVRGVVVADRFVFIVLVDFHVETGLLSTGDVKRRAARPNGTLDAGADVLLLANVTRKTPARQRNLIDVANRLEENRIGEMNFGNPDRANDVSPTFAVIDQFECAEPIRTENALNRFRWRMETTTTQPLT